MTATNLPSPTSGSQFERSRPGMSRVLWVVQGLLALEFLFTSGTKLLLPLAALEAQMPVPLPGLFVRFLGVCELLGALGLVLPGLLRIQPRLTPLAAAGLVIIMIGATVYTLVFMGVLPALLPLITGLFAAFVAYGRWRLAPLGGPSRLLVLRPSSARG